MSGKLDLLFYRNHPMKIEIYVQRAAVGVGGQLGICRDDGDRLCAGGGHVERSMELSRRRNRQDAVTSYWVWEPRGWDD